MVTMVEVEGCVLNRSCRALVICKLCFDKKLVPVSQGRTRGHKVFEDVLNCAICPFNLTIRLLEKAVDVSGDVQSIS